METPSTRPVEWKQLATVCSQINPIKVTGERSLSVKPRSSPQVRLGRSTIPHTGRPFGDFDKVVDCQLHQYTASQCALLTPYVNLKPLGARLRAFAMSDHAHPSIYPQAQEKPTNCGLRRNARYSKHEMFNNRKPTHDFVLTLNTMFCSSCHRLADI